MCSSAQGRAIPNSPSVLRGSARIVSRAGTFSARACRGQSEPCFYRRCPIFFIRGSARLRVLERGHVRRDLVAVVIRLIGRTTIPTPHAAAPSRRRSAIASPQRHRIVGCVDREAFDVALNVLALFSLLHVIRRRVRKIWAASTRRTIAIE